MCKIQGRLIILNLPETNGHHKLGQHITAWGYRSQTKEMGQESFYFLGGLCSFLVEKISTASHSEGKAGVVGQSGLWAAPAMGLAQAWVSPCYPGWRATGLWGPIVTTCV